MSFNSFREDCQAVLLLLSNLLYHILYNDAKSRARSRWNLYGAYETHVLPPNYHSLKANEIRILALLPSTDRTARLQGRFETYNLDNDNEASSKADQNGYEAVFYNRTTPRTMGSIVIESKIVFIPLDLQRALFWLRYTHEERRLWADAICINDSDPLEEFIQISLFSQIYKRATKAIAWIGEVKEAEEEAYRPFLEALQHPGSFLLFLRSGGLAHISGFKVLIEPFRRWKLIRNKRASLCRELMLAGKISFKLERYDIPGRFLDSLMWNYSEVMKLQRSERSTSTLFTPDTSGALRVKALLIDYIEDVGDIDEEEQYDNGPFPKPWVTLGAIEELLTMLRRSDKGLVSRKTLKNLSSLLDRAYSQSEQDPNPSYRLEAYNTYGTLIRQVKKATRGHRLIKTAHLSRLGLASPSVQKKDGE